MPNARRALALVSLLLPACAGAADPGAPLELELASVRQAIVDPDLVAQFDFEEGSGSTTADASGRGHTGTLVNGPAWTPLGHTGGALYFDGVNDRVTTVFAADLNLWNAVTVAAWVRPELTTGWRTVLFRQGNGTLNYALYAADGGGGPGGYVHDGADRSAIQAAPTLPLATWSHVAFTVTANTLTLYRDGVAVATGPVPGPLHTSTRGLQIGGNTFYPGEYFKGRIDEVRLYSRALTATEIGVLAGTVVSCPPGFADCDGLSANGCEVNLATDPQNCGACASVCALANAVSSCSGGQCVFDYCLPNWADCDLNLATGCEAPMNTPANCGGCGNVCSIPNAAASCSNNQCVFDYCLPSWADCDLNLANGCEAPMNTPANCGGCGNVCSIQNAAAVCNNNQCVFDYCLPGFADANQSLVDGCETPF